MIKFGDITVFEQHVTHIQKHLDDEIVVHLVDGNEVRVTYQNQERRDRDFLLLQDKIQTEIVNNRPQGCNSLIIVNAITELKKSIDKMYIAPLLNQRQDNHRVPANNSSDDIAARLDRSIYEYMFGCRNYARICGCLASVDIHTMRDLVQWEKRDLLKIRNFGKLSLTILDEIMEDNGFYLGFPEKNYPSTNGTETASNK